jgi:hypothetical protein
VGIKLLGSLSRSITWKFKEEEEEERKKFYRNDYFRLRLHGAANFQVDCPPNRTLSDFFRLGASPPPSFVSWTMKFFPITQDRKNI